MTQSPCNVGAKKPKSSLTRGTLQLPRHPAYLNAVLGNSPTSGKLTNNQRETVSVFSLAVEKPPKRTHSSLQSNRIIDIEQAKNSLKWKI